MSNRVNVQELDQVVIKFSGDSGDGMQLTGTQFSNTSALLGNDVSTFPDYPAEIRAPQGTVGGVSGFQLHFGNKEVNTPGDFSDVLVAMNPAALNKDLRWLKKGATVIVDIDAFTDKNIEKAGYKSNPFTDEVMQDYNVIKAPITSLTRESIKHLGLDMKSITRSKNMFALGICYWLFDSPMEYTEAFFEKKFKKVPTIAEANKLVLRAGYNYGENTHAMPSFRVPPAQTNKGTYRNMNGNLATAWGLLAGAEKSNLPLFLGSYPITPASEILHEISARKDLGAKAFQAEDEIAGICTAIGAAFAGNLAVTTTSGPGLALKAEALGLAVITELPLVIVNVQRGGPSTGLPTKTEQSDLMQALYGRNGESPIMVMAASTPANCFEHAFYACKYAVEHMMPVILLTDGFLGNGSQPWKICKMADLPEIVAPIAKEGDDFLPYRRDAEKLIRRWAVPGTKGLEHRIGGLEKMADTGTVSYVPENHQVMTDQRAAKLEKVADYIPELKIEGNPDSDTLVVGWGGTYGHLRSTVGELNDEGKATALVHFSYINPLPKNTEAVLSKYKNIIVCEINMGQFATYLRSKFPHIAVHQYNKVQGLPFTVAELKEAISKIANGE